MEPLTIAMLVVAGLLVMFRLSLSTERAKKARRREGLEARDEETADDTVPPAGPLNL